MAFVVVDVYGGGVDRGTGRFSTIARVTRFRLWGAAAALTACQGAIVDVAESPARPAAAPLAVPSKVATVLASPAIEPTARVLKTPAGEPPDEPEAPPEASIPTPAHERCVEPVSVRSPAPPPSDEVCPADPGRPELTIRALSFRGLATRVKVEIADTPAQHERGLMYRTHLAEDRGMLFVFDDRRVRSFWMRDTCIPLDILFLDEDGVVVGIVEQAAPHTDDSREVGCASAFVLEVPGGWTRRHGVTPGMIAVLPERAGG